MTESQFSSADPWGLPPDEDVEQDAVSSSEDEPSDAEVTGAPPSDDGPGPVENSEAEPAAAAGDLNPESDGTADLGETLPEGSEPVSDEPPDVPDPAIVDGQVSPPDFNESQDSKMDDLHDAVAALGMVEEETEIELEAADSVSGESSELFVAEESEAESPDLDGLAEDLASAIPVPVDGSDESGALDELSQKVSAWNEGGVTEETEEPAAQDDSAGMNYWGDETASDPDGELPPVGNGEDSDAQAPEVEDGDDHPDSDGVRTEIEEMPADADSLTLSSMAVEAESVFGDEGQLGPVEELPDDLPSWAVEDTPIFGNTPSEPAAENNDSPEQDLAALQAATDQLGEPDINISSEPETADPFATDTDVQTSDEPDNPAPDTSVPDDVESGADGHSGDGRSEVDAPSEAESLQTLAEDLVAAETSQSDVEPAGDTNEDSLQDDSATEPYTAKPPAPRGALAAAAAFFSRSETSETVEEDSDEPAEDSQITSVSDIEESEPSAELGSWIEDESQAEPELPDEEGTGAASEADVVGEETEVEVVDPSASGIDSGGQDQAPSDQEADDPWATLIEEGSDPSGLDIAVGDQPVPSVYTELKELPPSLPLESEEDEGPDAEIGEALGDGSEADLPQDEANAEQSGGPSVDKNDWGSLWSDSAQGWVEDSDGGSEWRTIVTTADTMTTWQIDTYLGVVSGDAALEDGPIDETLPAARQVALDKMVSVAMTRAAHAVLAVNVSTVTIADAIFVTASGTAATLRTDD